jgi:hypothetical protein
MTSRKPNHPSSSLWRDRLWTACLAACLAAAVAAVALVACYQWRPELRLDMDDRLPPGVRGFYPPERQGKTSFAWSSGSVHVAFDLIDRRAPWDCRADIINWRSPTAGPARVQIRSGGSLLLDRQIGDATASLAFTIPADPAVSGIDFDIGVSPTFRPGPQDTRELGLAFEAIACGPAAGSTPRPAASVVARSAAAAAAVGLTLGVAGLPALAAVGMGTAVAVAQSWSLASGGAAQSLSSPPVFLLVVLFGLCCLLPVALAAGVLRTSLSTPARLAVAVSACAFYVKLIFLLHPEKDLVDAVFHAHRLEWVLAGRYYFTQLSTSATPFPYAIGLYVFSAPWSLLTSDHVTLLRIVVYASEALAGASLYAMIAGVWNDRAAGVCAVLLFHLLPIPYIVIGNANLTAAFGHSAALVAMTAAVTWTFGARWRSQLLGTTALAALAFLSHVGSATVLLPTLAALALYFWTWGGPSGRRQAMMVAAATGLALALAIGLYYAHFGSLYRPHIQKARAAITEVIGGGAAPAAPGIELTPASEPSQVPARKAPPLQLGLKGALAQTRGSLGWPIIVLALAGAWSLLLRRRVDRLVLGLGAWATAFVLFLGWSVLRTVEPKYVQDTWEFIGRVELATSPAAAVLAAAGAAWLWRLARPLRVLSAALVCGAGWVAARALSAWIF